MANSLQLATTQSIPNQQMAQQGTARRNAFFSLAHEALSQGMEDPAAPRATDSIKTGSSTPALESQSNESSWAETLRNQLNLDAGSASSLPQLSSTSSSITQQQMLGMLDKTSNQLSDSSASPSQLQLLSTIDSSVAMDSVTTLKGIADPIKGPVAGPVRVPITGPIATPIQGPVYGAPRGLPFQPIHGPGNGGIGIHINGPVTGPIAGPVPAPGDGWRLSNFPDQLVQRLSMPNVSVGNASQPLAAESQGTASKPATSLNSGSDSLTQSAYSGSAKAASGSVTASAGDASNGSENSRRNHEVNTDGTLQTSVTDLSGAVTAVAVAAPVDPAFNGIENRLHGKVPGGSTEIDPADSNSSIVAPAFRDAMSHSPVEIGAGASSTKPNVIRSAVGEPVQPIASATSSGVHHVSQSTKIASTDGAITSSDLQSSPLAGNRIEDEQFTQSGAMTNNSMTPLHELDKQNTETQLSSNSIIPSSQVQATENKGLKKAVVDTFGETAGKTGDNSMAQAALSGHATQSTSETSSQLQSLTAESLSQSRTLPAHEVGTTSTSWNSSTASGLPASSHASVNLPSTNGSPFDGIDSGASAPSQGWLRASAHQVEAGYNDPSLGWVEVRAYGGMGGVHATLLPSNAGAADTLTQNLTGLSTYLNEHERPVASLHVSGAPSDSGASLASDSAGTGAGQHNGQATSNSFESGSAPEDKTVQSLGSVNPPSTRNLVTPVNGAGSEFPAAGYATGGRISVLA